MGVYLPQVSVEPEIRDELIRLAQEDSRTLSGLIRAILTQYVRSKEKS